MKQHSDWLLWREALADALFIGKRRVETTINGRRYGVALERLPSGFIVAEAREAYSGELTLREKDILRMIADDHKPQEIANRFKLSTHTVDSYRRNIKEKLQVKGAAGMTRWALRVGLIEP